jgi:GNAT superfamily N-acetyltransferase
MSSPPASHRRPRPSRASTTSPEFSRFLYTAVGGDRHWLDRLRWTLRQWTDWLSRPGAENWVAWVNGAPAGYVELNAAIHDDGTHAEIAFSGLLPRYIGRGLGGQLLAHGITKAWTVHERFPELPSVTRVWVHTCSLDGPHALANYQALAFFFLVTFINGTGNILLFSYPNELFPTQVRASAVGSATARRR